MPACSRWDGDHGVLYCNTSIPLAYKGLLGAPQHIVGFGSLQSLTQHASGMQSRMQSAGGTVYALPAGAHAAAFVYA